MDYKLELAAELRKGLVEIKAIYKGLLADNPLWTHWTYLNMYERGMEWENNR